MSNCNKPPNYGKQKNKLKKLPKRSLPQQDAQSFISSLCFLQHEAEKQGLGTLATALQLCVDVLYDDPALCKPDEHHNAHDQKSRTKARQQHPHIDEIMGKNLHTLRTTHKLTQTDIARILSITPQAVHKHERGTARLSASALYLLAETLRVDIRCFYHGILPRHQEKPSHQDNSRILHAINRMEDSDQKTQLLTLAKNLPAPEQ